jgi:hypothetical protein
VVSIMPGCKVSSSFHAAGDLSIIRQKIFPSWADEDGYTDSSGCGHPIRILSVGG